MELIFFMAACLLLCFRFMTKTVSTTHQGFSYCWAAHSIKAFSILTLPSRQVRLGISKRLRGDTVRLDDTNWSKRYSMPHNSSLPMAVGLELIFKVLSNPSHSLIHVIFSNKNWGVLFPRYCLGTVGDSLLVRATVLHHLCSPLLFFFLFTY